MSAVPVVHAITNDEILLRDDFPQQARDVMAALGGQGAIHVRARWLSGRELYRLAVLVQELTRESGCWAVVNDRVDVACAAGVRGVQLTSRSILPEAARSLCSGVRVGASVHSAAEAVAAEAGGADWCIAGSAYPTPTHPEREAGGVSLMREVAAAVTIPVIAIGGVTPERISLLRSAGLHGVATIRGVWHASDVGEAALRYLSAYAAHRSSD